MVSIASDSEVQRKQQLASRLMRLTELGCPAAAKLGSGRGYCVVRAVCGVFDSGTVSGLKSVVTFVTNIIVAHVKTAVSNLLAVGLGSELGSERRSVGGGLFDSRRGRCVAVAIIECPVCCPAFPSPSAPKFRVRKAHKL